MLLRYLLCGVLVSRVVALSTDRLYPYGWDNGDAALPKSDDISSEPISLKVPIKFFSELYDRLYVNNNGLVSILGPLEEYVSVQFPLEYLVIAPLYSNVDTRRGGTVWYRESVDPAVLQRASDELTEFYPALEPFRPQAVFITTWDKVAHVNATDQANTFQMVLASDGTETFLELLYPDGGIQWIRTRGQGHALADAKAQAGIVSHDARLFNLPNSGTDRIRFLDKLTNAGEPGLFVFRVGNIGESENVEPPPAYQGYYEQEPRSCDQGFTSCHSKAKCQDEDNRFCCVCEEGYYGNGKECLVDDKALRVSGRVNMAGEGEMYLQAYLVPSDGASYTAITRVPSRLGPSLQLLEPLASTLGWLVAKPIAAGLNGFQLTGGVFNSSVIIHWPGGEKMSITAYYLGVDLVDQIRMEAEVSGTLPAVPPHKTLSIQDYIQDLTPTSTGQLRSQTKLNIIVDNRAKEKGTFLLTKTETISFNPTCSIQGLTSLRLKSSRHQLVYKEEENVVRFASFNKISSNKEGEDPCIEGQIKCVANSSCVVDGDSFKCICNPGFEVMVSDSVADGCQDINECEEGSANCDPQAICVNEVGTFHCQCKPGFRGDGLHCEPECGPDGDCQENKEYSCEEGQCPDCRGGYKPNIIAGRFAGCLDVDECEQESVCNEQGAVECINTEGSYYCICRPGYHLVNNICISTSEVSVEDPCEEDPESCQPQNAYCDDIRDIETCRCVSGWRESTLEGKFSCVDRNECAEDSPCDINAQCFNNWGSFDCSCRHGYTGDGFTCSPLQGINDCGGLECDSRSHCEDDLEGPRCVCDSQYLGQPPNCKEVEMLDCFEDADCDVNAKCDQTSDYHHCVCKHGYQGNGYECIPTVVIPQGTIVRTCLHGNCWCPTGYIDNGVYCIVKNSKDDQCRNRCGANSQCLWVSHAQEFQCSCNPGYEGDGFQCTEMEISCKVAEICDINASCRYDETSGRDICICNEGFVGDGITCYPTDECISSEDCKENAGCLYNEQKGAYECVCPFGYMKADDGFCIQTGNIVEESSESLIVACSGCSEYAACVDGQCICKDGFSGDGKNCDADCSMVGGCSPDADCVYTQFVGHSCVCRQGYEGDGYSCNQVKNCLNTPYLCSVHASCLRTTQKTYICTCNQGFYGNGSYCKEGTKLEGGGFLLVNKGRSTLQIPLDDPTASRGRPIHFHHDQVPIGIAVDCVEGRIYWSDIAKKSIQSSKYDGSDMQPEIISGLESSEGLAIDWLNRAIYWTDSGKDSVSKADLVTKEVMGIAENDLINPRGIAVHPARRKVYWSDWNRNDPKLEYSNLDGSNRAVLLKGKHVMLPNSLAIDWSSDELCWADAGTKNIECLGLSTRIHRTAVEGCRYPFGLAITPEKYYWTDWVTHKIESAYKDGSMSEPLELIFGGDDKLYGIAAVTDSCPN